MDGYTIHQRERADSRIKSQRQICSAQQDGLRTFCLHHVSGGVVERLTLRIADHARRRHLDIGGVHCIHLIH